MKEKISTSGVFEFHQKDFELISIIFEQVLSEKSFNQKIKFAEI